MYEFSPPLWLSVLATMLAAWLIYDALRRTAGLVLTQTDYRVWAALSLLVLLGHFMTVSLPGGIEVHYLGAAFLAATLGYTRALISLSVILLVISPVAEAGLQILLNGVLPAWCMHRLVQGARRWLPRNPFVFMLGCGFFGLFLVSALQLMANALVALWLGQSPTTVSWMEILAYQLLLVAGEATLEGMLLTLMVVYWPHVVAMFDERDYPDA